MKRVSLKPQIVWAAFNPETGFCMTPTLSGLRSETKRQRDAFYIGCTIHKCHLVPVVKRRWRYAGEQR